MLHTHDPIITKKIHFIKGLLKEYAIYSRTIKEMYAAENRLVSKYMLENDCDYYDACRKTETTRTYPPSPATWLYYLTITYLHVYYLKVKGSTKQHTKDDKKYESNVYYKIVVEGLEKDFQLLLEVGKEGNYVAK